MNNTYSNNIMPIFIGVIFVAVGFFILFSDSSKTSETINCDKYGECVYQSKNIKNKINDEYKFNIKKVKTVDSKTKVTHSHNGNSRTTVYYIKYLSDGTFEKIYLTSDMYKSFKKYFSENASNMPNSAMEETKEYTEYSHESRNTSLFSGSFIMIFMGIIAIFAFK